MPDARLMPAGPGAKAPAAGCEAPASGAWPPVSPDTCPRCGGAFTCGAQGPGPCACTGLKLSPETLKALQEQYRGCLCLPCLAALTGPAAG